VRLIWSLFAVAGLALALSPHVAQAETKVTEPERDPYPLVLDDDNTPEPFTITASGFAAGALVYVEQCDSNAPTSENWRPTINCDGGTSPAPAIVDDEGIATFPADDRNKSFHPFLGESPQQLFNCVPEGTDAPKNGLPTHSSCQIRVSSNNFTATPDQVFLNLALGGSSSSDIDDDSSSSSIVPILFGVGAALLVLVGAWWLLTRRREQRADLGS
jgi:hypothetical protein